MPSWLITKAPEPPTLPGFDILQTRLILGVNDQPAFHLRYRPMPGQFGGLSLHIADGLKFYGHIYPLLFFLK